MQLLTCNQKSSPSLLTYCARPSREDKVGKAKSADPIITSSYRFVNTPGMEDVESCHVQSDFTLLDLADTTKVVSEESTHCLSHVHMDILVHEGKAYRTTVSRNAASVTQMLSLKSEVYDSERDNWTVQGELPFPAIESVLQAVW